MKTELKHEEKTRVATAQIDRKFGGWVHTMIHGEPFKRGFQSGASRVHWKKILNEHYGKINATNARRLIGDHHDEFLQLNQPSSRTLCGHMDNEDGRASGVHGHPPFHPWGSVDAKVATSKTARAMGFGALWRRACGEAFIASDYVADHPQYDWLDDYLIDRPARHWQTFVDD